VVVSEQRPDRVLGACDRVLFLDRGRIVLDAPQADALDWLARNRPAWLPRQAEATRREPEGEPACRLDAVSFGYVPERPVLADAALDLRRGEVVALTGPNGSGKTTLAKIAAGLLEPGLGTVARSGRACYLPQDRAATSCASEWRTVALAVDGDLERPGSTWFAWRLQGPPPARPLGGARAPLSPPSSSRSRICSCSTSRRAGLTLSARTS
jgi:energy-coupling factor transporter ATP-binding protein EcfA2